MKLLIITKNVPVLFLNQYIMHLVIDLLPLLYWNDTWRKVEGKIPETLKGCLLYSLSLCVYVCTSVDKLQGTRFDLGTWFLG